MANKITKPYDSKIPAFNLVANFFDLWANEKKWELFLENISDEERDFLYNHPITNELKELLP